MTYFFRFSLISILLQTLALALIFSTNVQALSIAAPHNELSILTVNGTISTNMACTANCGNCCTGQMISNSSSNITIGSSAIILDDFSNNNTLHTVKGYYYEALGSCDMNSCSFFHIISVDQDRAVYDAKSGQIKIPSVSAGAKSYELTLKPPYAVEKIVEILSPGGNCSQTNTQCSDGYTCTSYFGIAGTELKSCEISCINGQFCPTGTSCVAYADGPQNICK